MKIWHLDFEVDEYDSLETVKEFDLDERQSYDGRSKLEGWKPIAVKKMAGRELSNVPGYSSYIPVFDRAAMEIVEDLIKENCEVLPLICADGEFYIINVTTVLDAIDYSKSKFKRFSTSNRIMRFIKYEFIKEKVEGQHIFKIIDEPLRRPFVSDEFRQRVLESNLKGFKFELVWDSEAEVVE